MHMLENISHCNNPFKLPMGRLERIRALTAVGRAYLKTAEVRVGNIN